MKCYNDIDRTPLPIFVDCYVDNLLESLIIEGDVPRETLNNAWEMIAEQFATRMSNTVQRTYLRLLKETNELSATINQVNSLVTVMYEAYHPLLGKMINTLLKSNIQWPAQDRKLINATLKRCESLIKPLDMRFEMKKIQLEVIIKQFDDKAKDGVKPTREYFNLLLNLIEEHFSVPADHNMLTGRFCDKVTRMNEQIKKRKHGRPTRR